MADCCSWPHAEPVPSAHQWTEFLVASLLFIQVPGPSLLFTIGRPLTVGRRDALLSVVGNALGVVGQVLLVAVGLGALVATSAAVCTGVEVAGAAYVVWLGVQAIRHRRDARDALLAAGPATPRSASARRCSPRSSREQPAAAPPPGEHAR